MALSLSLVLIHRVEFVSDYAKHPPVPGGKLPGPSSQPAPALLTLDNLGKEDHHTGSDQGLSVFAPAVACVYSRDIFEENSIQLIFRLIFIAAPAENAEREERRPLPPSVAGTAVAPLCSCAVCPGRGGTLKNRRSRSIDLMLVLAFCACRGGEGRGGLG